MTTPKNIHDAFARANGLRLAGCPESHPAVDSAYKEIDKHFGVGLGSAFVLPDDMAYELGKRMWETNGWALKEYLSKRGVGYRITGQIFRANEQQIRSLATEIIPDFNTNSYSVYVQPQNVVTLLSTTGWTADLTDGASL